MMLRGLGRYLTWCLCLWNAASKNLRNESYRESGDPVPLLCGKSNFHASHRETYGGESQNQTEHSKRIVEGQPSESAEWPWLVSMQLSRFGAKHEHLCGGTLIHPQWVLSAAHCFASYFTDFLTDDPSAWLVRLGEHDLLTDDVPHVEVPPVRIILHPDWNVTKLNLDIALIKLERPVKLRDGVNVACLPDAENDFPAGSTCATAGWGHTKEGGNLSAVVRHVAVQVVSQEECQLRYLFANPPVHVTDDMLCTAGMAGGMGACQLYLKFNYYAAYDSGGPLVCFDAKDDHWLLIGTYSGAVGCGRAHFPAIYTEVTDFVPWINVTITNN